MDGQTRCLAVIPARGGSKGIPGKNMRILHGRPLIGYVLEVATTCRMIDEIVVSSDDPNILQYAASVWGVRTRCRPDVLAGDNVTLDPVVHDAVTALEKELDAGFDIIITLQPTSPTLSIQSLEKALNEFLNGRAETCISVVSDTHLKWQIVDGKPNLVQAQRVNRQYLPEEFREAGAFVITRRECVTPTSRFGEMIELFPLSQEEGIDVDNPVDWLVAETMMKRLRIALIVRGSKAVGMGHAYRGLTIADSLLGHELRFCSFQSDSFVAELIRKRGYDVDDVPSIEGICERLREFGPNIILCDILDTSFDLVHQLQALGAFTVTFEDLGEGSHHADLVFNALYELSSPPLHHRFGAQYVCLPSAFHAISPAPFRIPASTALITFGGTDERNLTVLSCKVVTRLLREERLACSIVILGPGYAHGEEFCDMLESLETNVRDRIEVCRDIQNMASMMSRADIGITSNGRTVYELAAMGVPSICAAQNDRETSHLFSRYSRGFEYLGMGITLTEERVYNEMCKILMDSKLRQGMREVLLTADLRDGIRRVKEEILTEYWRWKDGGPANRNA